MTSILTREGVERSVKEMWDAISDSPRDESWDAACSQAQCAESRLREALHAQEMLFAAAPQLLEACKAIANHFSDVMGGPLISGRGITFANGVEGIPTIAAARAAIAAAEGAQP